MMPRYVTSTCCARLRFVATSWHGLGKGGGGELVGVSWGLRKVSRHKYLGFEIVRLGQVLFVAPTDRVIRIMRGGRPIYHYLTPTTSALLPPPPSPPLPLPPPPLDCSNDLACRNPDFPLFDSKNLDPSFDICSSFFLNFLTREKFSLARNSMTSFYLRFAAVC
jgi:hypothetical protein